MIRRRLLPIALLGLVALPAMGQEAKKSDAKSESVRSMLRSYVEAFNKKDLDTVASLWAKDCTYTDRSTGERSDGRESLRSDLKQVFAAEPKMQLSASLDRVKFITDDVVQIEGQTLLTSPDADPLPATFTAVLIKNGKSWQISTLQESAVAAPATPQEALQDLEWMIGSWVDQGEDARVESTVRWADNGSFLLRSYAVATEGGVAQQGTQVIGWDPRAEQIRSWAFNSDGSFGEGRWSKSGDDWLVKSAQTLPDGRAATGTYVISNPDEETIQIKLIGHTIAGEPQPAQEAVVMKRQAETTAEDAPAEAAAEGTTEPTKTN